MKMEPFVREVEKRGGWKTSRVTPLQEGVLDPPSYGTFSTPLRCQCSVFPVQKSTAEQTRSSFGGVKKFLGECVLLYVFLPPYVLHPPYHGPKLSFWRSFPCLTVISFQSEVNPCDEASWGLVGSSLVL